MDDKVISDIKYNVKLDVPLLKMINSCFGQIKQINQHFFNNVESYEILTFSVVAVDDISRFEAESQFMVDNFYAKYDDGFTMLSIRIREKSIREIKYQFRAWRD